MSDSAGPEAGPQRAPGAVGGKAGSDGRERGLGTGAVGGAVPSGKAGQFPAALQRPFRAIIFDWDGTAVANRLEDAGPLAGALTELLRLGVWIVVVTGVRLEQLDQQLGQWVAPEVRQRLLACTNRGSEVWGFDRRGQAVRRWRRVASAEEEAALTATAEAVRDELTARTGLEVGIVYDRPNRRKIDLIPTPEWANPGKDQFGPLLEAVEARLRGAGLTGGLREAVALTQRLAAEQGLPEARITSDVKHLEVGLTDKGDSVDWIREHLLMPRRIPLQDVLMCGDELGPVDGLPGSDAPLRTGLAGAVAVSVGAEPGGVPPGVVHLAGGPKQFRALLAAQAALQRERRRAVEEDGALAGLLSPPADPAWRLEERGYRPTLEHEVESRLAISNGFIGTRAALEPPAPTSRPSTFVAGLFDLPPNEWSGPVLAPAPDWSRLRVAFNAEALPPELRRLPAHPRTLDLCHGTLLTAWRLVDQQGRTLRFRGLRFVSLARRRVAVQVAEVSVDQAVPVTLKAMLAPVDEALRLERAEPGLSVWLTSRSRRPLAIASSATLCSGGVSLTPALSEDGLTLRWHWPAEPHSRAVLVRIVALARGEPGEDPAEEALAERDHARRLGLARLVAEHRRAWEQRWAASDVEVEGDDDARRALRFAIYHLNSAANPEDERTSIGARALTGEAYQGHVFWDTEIFLLPFYIFTWPEAARTMLLYRYHTLPAARAKAARYGYRGALYAWESADTGEEATPTQVLGPDGEVVEILCGLQEHHISADVAYAVWQYWRATEDERFLLEAGAEIVLETARFWASRARLEADGRYHIRGVIGPDEYHECVDDNAYTNVLAQWNLERGLEVAALLERRWPQRWSELCEQIRLRPEELDDWREVAERMTVLEDRQTGVLEQFEGFFGLEQINLAEYATRTAPMDVLLGRERTQGAQVIKQADVVMLLALLPERFSPEQAARNFHYYEPRTGHGSSLSPAVHALVAARLGDASLAEAYFHQAGAIDLDDSMGNAALGVHIAAQGGLWQAAVFGFAGLTAQDDRLSFRPHLPATWQKLRFTLQWRGRELRVEIGREPLRFGARLTRGRPLQVELDGEVEVLRRGEARVWETGRGWGADEEA